MGADVLRTETEPVPVIGGDEEPMEWLIAPTTRAHKVANVTLGVCLLFVAAAIAFYVLSGAQ